MELLIKQNSNTTLVKVKSNSTPRKRKDFFIQIQHLLKLNSLQKFPLGSVYLIQIQHLLKLNKISFSIAVKRGRIQIQHLLKLNCPLKKSKPQKN